MTTKKLTNGQIVQIMRGMTDSEGEALRKKQLPFRLVYAMRRSMSEVQSVYSAYEATLVDICSRYHISLDQIDAADDACKQEIADLVGMEVEVAIQTVPRTTMDEVVSDRYDPLSYEDMDRLFWLMED